MKRNQTSRFFDSYAADFNALYNTDNSIRNRLINYLFRRSMRLRFRKTLEGCQPANGKTVLDIGCGPGHYGIALVRQGISEAVGIDFAPGMIELARSRAKKERLDDKCHYIEGDFLTHSFEDKFDYCILNGFMDYVSNPGDVIEKALSLTRSKAFFSFPAAGGFLAWQRQIRYKNKCDLYLYKKSMIVNLFSRSDYRNIDITKIRRDYFVTVFLR